MRKITLLITFICALFITTATAQKKVNQTAVFDFTSNMWEIKTFTTEDKTPATGKNEHSDGENTITITARGGRSYYYDDDCLRMDKAGVMLSLPKFDFDVDKIEVIGHSKAKQFPNADINIKVGNNEASTAVAGLTDSHIYEIAADYQAAGNVYNIVVGNGGGDYSSVVFITCIKVYPADSDDAITLKAPVLDNGSGVYTEPVTVKVSSPTTEAEGIENVVYYYTTDGYEPDAECAKAENGQITISESCTLKVILEFTYNDMTYTSEPTTAEYIISEEVTYIKATTVAVGKYFIVAEGNIALPFKDGKLPTKETNVDGNNVTDAEYYAFSIEDEDREGNIVAGEFYIKDTNGLYITAHENSKTDEIKSTTTTDHANWSITIENNNAKISRGGYILVYRDNNIVAIKKENATETEVYPSLYTVAAEVEPITATASPSETVSTIWGDGDISITFNKPVEYTEPEGGLKIVNANSEVVSNITTLTFNEAKTKAYVMLDTPINQTGTYTLTIPAGTFTSEDGTAIEETIFTFNVEAVEPEPTWQTDFDNTSSVNEFEKLTISFENASNIKLNEGVTLTLYTKSGASFQGTPTLIEVEDKDGKTTTKIEITFGEKLTSVDTCYVTIPEGLFTMNEDVINEKKELTFEIVAPIEVDPLEIVSVKALENGLLEIVYNQNITLNWDGLSQEITIINDKNEEVTLNKYETPEWPSMRMLYTSTETTWNGYEYEIVPIVAGTYTVDVAQVIVKYGYDAETYDYVTQGACEGIYTVTISDTAIDGIEAETENAEIYDLTGRRVNNITKAGIYIVNGVKKIVK